MTAYRVKPGIPVVIVKDKANRIQYHYAVGVSHNTAKGPHIPWISDKQASHLLRHGLIERIDDPAEPAESDAEPAAAVAACTAALNSLGLPLDAGAPSARESLRDSGHKFANETIAAAIKERRELSRTASGS
jgi:hypothetical protein